MTTSQKPNVTRSLVGSLRQSDACGEGSKALPRLFHPTFETHNAALSLAQQCVSNIELALDRELTTAEVSVVVKRAYAIINDMCRFELWAIDTMARSGDDAGIQCLGSYAELVRDVAVTVH